ncbi:hypothetical protein IB267_03955 [Ensifer sp. ENS09]|uniref:hypothetical protein n=1 Tax=Ensifer sp. ENS09 TaxID=2769263 RepID=UPI00178007E4|nr:hypothetical protein [Ensifer sp. ENS09]MBD9647505.1 hypothetical protein [Ensifer sp. ENS09]
MSRRYLIAALCAALLVAAGCTTDQAGRTSAHAPSPSYQGMQGAQGMSQGGGGAGGY